MCVEERERARKDDENKRDHTNQQKNKTTTFTRCDKLLVHGTSWCYECCVDGAHSSLTLKNRNRTEEPRPDPQSAERSLRCAADLLFAERAFARMHMRVGCRVALFGEALSGNACVASNVWCGKCTVCDHVWCALYGFMMAMLERALNRESRGRGARV